MQHNDDIDFTQALKSLKVIQDQEKQLEAPHEAISFDFKQLFQHYNTNNKLEDLFVLFSSCTTQQISTLCEVLNQLGHKKEIDTFFNVLLRLNEQNKDILLQTQYEIYKNLNDFQSCIRIQLLRLDSVHPQQVDSIRFDVAHLYYVLNKFDDALSIANQLIVSFQSIELRVKILCDIQQIQKALDILVTETSKTSSQQEILLFLALQAKIIFNFERNESKALSILQQVSVEENECNYEEIQHQILSHMYQTLMNDVSLTEIENKGQYFQLKIKNAKITEKERGRLYQQVGEYYQHNILPSLALECYLKAIKTHETNTTKFMIVSLLQNLGMWQLSFDFLQKCQQTYYLTFYYLSLQFINYSKHKEALQYLNKCTELNPHFAQALFFKAQCLVNLQKFNEAHNILSQLVLKVDSQHIQIALISLNQVQGIFENYSSESRYVISAVDDYVHKYFNRQHKLNPYDLLHRSPIPQRQTFLYKIEPTQIIAMGKINANLNFRKLKFMQQQLKSLYPTFTFEHLKDCGDKSLRVGFLLSTTTESPIMWIIFKWFEKFNQSQFQCYVYATDKQVSSTMQKYVKQKAYQYSSRIEKDPFEYAKTIYNDNIQILINFNLPGVTAECQICALRPAPIQILSFNSPGTSGAQYYDYILSDNFQIPIIQYPNYTEQIIALSRPPAASVFYDLQDTYTPIQPNSELLSTVIENGVNTALSTYSEHNQSDITTKSVSEKSQIKTKLNITENAFVIGCLSQVYKLEPDLLQILVQICSQHHDVFLVFLGYPLEASQRLTDYFEHKNIQNIRFLSTKNPAEQARLCCILDLYVDSAKICGCHSVYSAIAAGIPVIGLSTVHMCQRTTGSILNYVGLTDLICSNFQELGEKCLYLISNKARLEQYKQIMIKQRKNIFDVDGYVTELQQALKTVWELWAGSCAKRCIFGKK